MVLSDGTPKPNISWQTSAPFGPVPTSKGTHVTTGMFSERSDIGITAYNVFGGDIHHLRKSIHIQLFRTSTNTNVKCVHACFIHSCPSTIVYNLFPVFGTFDGDIIGVESRACIHSSICRPGDVAWSA